KCSAEVTSGWCKDDVLKYRYNTENRACEHFWWGGCEDNGNVFETKVHCEATCKHKEAVLEVVDLVSKCYHFYERGPCSDYLQRYYYDAMNQKCTSFIYGGCQGNENNFLSLEACQKECMSRTIKPKEKTNNFVEKVPQRLACASGPCKNGFPCQSFSNVSYICNCNPDWGRQCQAPPDYWCFSDRECDSEMKCTRTRKCKLENCHIYARCSPKSKKYVCDQQTCDSGQECVNDQLITAGFICKDPNFEKSMKILESLAL
uniref:BPTI/Kunitz inhibitor domain-containing protein n=1 Tax=Biomphalaria glabrata TaxID=6526 RepID=A0A2C9JLS0_BIOGL